jgi:hypothetical protein
MRPIATLLATLALSLTALGLAVAAPGGLGGRQELARVEIQSASGAVSIANSRAGQALFDAAAMRPGEGVSGTVTIANDGDQPGRFAVHGSGVSDVPGPNGGRLSERVELVVFDVTDVRSPVTVYAGAPADFAQVDLGVLGAGQERAYLFAVTLPDGGDDGDDNLFQGAGLSLGFRWSAVTIPSPATPTPTPTATPTPVTPTATPTPTGPTSTPSVPVALADELGMPAATSCIKKGTLKLRVKAPARAKVVSAVVKVNGKVKAKLKGKKAAKPVTLRGLKKTTKLAVTIKASNKRTYSATRTYKACR